MHRKIVYHESYDQLGSEEHRADYSKIVSSEAELKALGPKWGAHPALKKSAPKVESMGEEKIEVPQEKSEKKVINKKSKGE